MLLSEQLVAKNIPEGSSWTWKYTVINNMHYYLKGLSVIQCDLNEQNEINLHLIYKPVIAYPNKR